MDEDALCPEKCKKSVENLFLRIPRLGKILGQNPGVSVVPDAADQIDRGVVAGKAGCLAIEKEQIGESSLPFGRIRGSKGQRILNGDHLAVSSCVGL